MKPLELSHDIIAKKVWERLPEIDKQLQIIKKSLIQRQKDAAEGEGSFLGAKELAAWETAIDRLKDNLDPDVLTYIKKSKDHVEKQAQEKAAQLKKEGQRKRTRIFSIIITIAFLFSLLLAFYAVKQTQIAREQTRLANEATKRANTEARKAKEALANLQVEKQKVASLEKKLGILQNDIVPDLEALAIEYSSSNQTDVSGMLHRVLDMMAERFPNDIKKPSIQEARDSRSIAKWYHDQGDLIIIKDALSEGLLIQPGAIIWYGNQDKTYENATIEDLTVRGGINHVGIVVRVTKDETGEVTSYDLFHARGIRKPAATTTCTRINPRRPDLPAYGNGKEPWVAIAYPLGKEKK